MVYWSREFSRSIYRSVLAKLGSTFFVTFAAFPFCTFTQLLSSKRAEVANVPWAATGGQRSGVRYVL